MPVVVRRKTLPCTKGIKTKCGSKSAFHGYVERHCPVRKGLRHQDLSVSYSILSRKTLPCTKGIKTPHGPMTKPQLWRRKTLPCTKGIKTDRGTIVIISRVERHCPVRKGLRLVLYSHHYPTVLSKDTALYERD